MRTTLKRILLTGAALAMAGAAFAAPASISKKPWGTAPDGKAVALFALRNTRGAEAQISNYGGLVTSLKVPDKAGKLGDVVWGYDTLAEYVENSPYFGALIGRYGNRICKGQFKLDGKSYKLAVNNGANALHGGKRGFDKVVWQAATAVTANGPMLTLTRTSKDMEEGYPGNLKVKTVYTLTNDNALKVEYTATTDKPTVLNLTHHSYFNLAGDGNILKHQVMINADRFTPVDETLIPTGELKPVAGTPFDFRKPFSIGARIEAADPQIKFGGGYDHNWVINKPAGKLDVIARVSEPTSGRVMEVLSTEPGLQFYTGNFLDGTIVGKGGKIYERRSAFCMEPQHYPDSPNKPKFPSVVLRPGQTYQNTIIYRFSVKK